MLKEITGQKILTTWKEGGMLFEILSFLVVVSHIYHPSMWDVEAGGSGSKPPLAT